MHLAASGTLGSHCSICQAECASAGARRRRCTSGSDAAVFRTCESCRCCSASCASCAMGPIGSPSRGKKCSIANPGGRLCCYTRAAICARSWRNCTRRGSGPDFKLLPSCFSTTCLRLGQRGVAVPFRPVLIGLGHGFWRVFLPQLVVVCTVTPTKMALSSAFESFIVLPLVWGWVYMGEPPRALIVARSYPTLEVRPAAYLHLGGQHWQSRHKWPYLSARYRCHQCKTALRRAY
jgi:hypothetical protein